MAGPGRPVPGREPEGVSAPLVIRSLELRANSSLAIAEQIQEGLAYRKVQVLQEALGVSAQEIAGAIGASPRTLARRKEEGVLTPEESDRLVQLGVLFDEALELFEQDVAGARDWFKRPNRALDETTPLEAANTFIGAREVQRLIGRLEHGVFA